MSRLSAHKRLKALPEVFTTRTLAAQLSGDQRLASVYIHRWRAEGHIASLGPRAGLHFNLLRRPTAEVDLQLDAIAYLFPGAMIAGVSAVHAAGWTTQIPACIEVMAPARRTFPALDGITLSGRPRRWFEHAREHISRPGPVPMVEPAFALADLWVTGAWRADPDDLDWEEIDGAALERSFALLCGEIPKAWRAEIIPGADLDLTLG